MRGVRHVKDSLAIDTFVVLDLDRTLFNTPVLVDAILLQLHDHGFSAAQINHYIEEIHSQTGTSLSLRDFFEFRVPGGELLYITLQQELLRFVQSHDMSEELLYPGSKDLHDTLDDAGTPFAILTYGNAVDQQFKLSLYAILTGRRVEDLHATITSEPKKAEWISEVWDEGGAICVPQEVYGQKDMIAEHVVIVDDKVHNLHSTHPRVSGILIDNEARAEHSMTLTSLVGALRSGIRLVDIAQSHDPIRD